MKLLEQTKGYFTMSDEEKDDLLTSIVIKYRGLVLLTGDSLEEVIEGDIKTLTDYEEFEAVQALTDIKNTIIRIRKEIE